MRYFFGTILLASMVAAAGSASAHYVHHKTFHLGRSIDGRRLYNYAEPSPFHPVRPNSNDPYGIGRAAVGGL